MSKFESRPTAPKRCTVQGAFEAVGLCVWGELRGVGMSGE